MIIIGELINGMYKAVAHAIEHKEADLVQHLAVDQVKAGANILDVSVGPYSKNPLDDMKWLVETIRKVADVPLSLDSTRPDVIEAGLKLAGKRSLINSTSADVEKMELTFGLTTKYHAQVIGLTMDKRGVPNTREQRVELAAVLISKAQEFGVATEDLFIDPIAFPVNVGQAQCVEVLEALREFRLIANPAPNTIIGLSNVSQGAKLKTRSLLNRAFLTMALASGLTSAIIDPLDKELVDTLIAAELILNKNIYCDSFLEAYRKK